MSKLTLTAVLAMAFAECASAKVECVNAKGWQINAEPSHADGVYQKGEDVSFDFLATEDGKPLANWDLELSVEKPGAALPEKKSVKTDAEGRCTFVVPAPAQPGWVLVNAMTLSGTGTIVVDVLSGADENPPIFSSVTPSTSMTGVNSENVTVLPFWKRHLVDTQSRSKLTSDIESRYRVSRKFRPVTDSTMATRES